MSRGIEIMKHMSLRWVVICLVFCLTLAGCASAPQERMDAVDVFMKGIGVETIGQTYSPVVYLNMSSDEVRKLRSVVLEKILVLNWEKHTQVLAEESSVEVTSGILRLGPDYFELEEDGKKVIYDFVLRRIYSYTSVESGYTNDSLFAPVAFFDVEAINRATLGAAFGDMMGQENPGHQQFWFEAHLGVPARNLPSITVETRNPNEDTVSIQWEGETVAVFRLGEDPVERPYSDVLARVLRYSLQIHPAALSEVLPFKRIPVEITSLHASQLDMKARTTIVFSMIGQETASFTRELT